MSVPIKPLNDYVVVVPEEAKTKTASGIYLPEAAKEKPQSAKVVAVGPGKVGDDNERIPMQVKVGDNVIYGGYSHTDVKIGGITYILVPENDIYATV
ncbi:MAG: co-chaperone GroES [bacterium]|nr:co-chaperone GroES [bacterium]